MKYRKVDPRIWNDQKFRQLSDGGKLLFFMLLTHPNMTPLGAMRATPSGLAEELGWLPEAFSDAFRQVLSKGMAEYASEAHLVALPQFMRYNRPEAPNSVKAWVASLDALPECELKLIVIQRAIAFADGMSKAFREAIPKGFMDALALPSGILEQELEQEQEPRKRLSHTGLSVDHSTGDDEAW